MNTGRSLVTVRGAVSLAMTLVMMVSLLCFSTPAVAATEMLSQEINLTDFVKSGLSEVAGDDYDGDGKYLKVTVAANSSGNPMSFVSVSDLDPNGVYKVTAWMKNDTAVKSAYLSATVTYYDGVAASGATVNNAQTLGEYRDPAFMQTVHTEWTQYVLTGIRPQADGVIKVGMWVNNTKYVDDTANTETDFVAYVDAVTVERVPETVSVAAKSFSAASTEGYSGTRPTDATDDYDGDGEKYVGTIDAGSASGEILRAWVTGFDTSKKYTVSLWYKSTGLSSKSGSFSVYVTDEDKKATQVGSADTGVQTATTEWKQVTISGVQPKNSAGQITIKCWVNPGSEAFTLEVDGCTITEEITPYSIDLADFERTNTTSTADVQGPDDADGDGKYLKITVPESGNTTVSSYNYTSKYAALDPNKTYTLAGWFKTSKEGANLGNFWVNCGNDYATKGDAYTLYSGKNNCNNGLTTEWKYYEIKNIVPSSDGDFKLGYWAHEYAASQEYVYIDGLTLYEQVDVSSLVTEAPAAVADALPTLTMLGASVRGNDEIRFGIEVGEKGWEEGTVVDEVKYGTLFIPTATLGDAELTLATADVLDVPTRLWQENMPGYEDRDLYTCVLTDVKTADTAITARGYMLYRVGDTWYVQYSGAASRTINGIKAAVEAAG